MAAASFLSACGVEISLRIGQRVHHRDHTGKRFTGIVNSLQVESEQGLTATIHLDEPIIIPVSPSSPDREIRIYWQTAPVTEFMPFDERDELIAEMLDELKRIADGEVMSRPFEHIDTVIEYQRIARAAIAKATGAAA